MHSPMSDRTPGREGDLPTHSLKPILLDAARAHREGLVEYTDDAVAVCRLEEIEPGAGETAARIPPDRQFPLIRATFDDLNKALSRFALSPGMHPGATLRDLYEEEVARYEALVTEALAAGRLEPDYGTYVFDRWQGNLYLIAPEPWHRLALVTSNSKLMTDPAGALSWRELRDRLENAVVGFAGASVGGNVVEGWLREARPKCIKVADPDWVELTNLNRGERMSLRHVGGSRGQRFEARNAFETPRLSKAEYLAYEQQLVDPYLSIYTYREGLTRANFERFLLGDGHTEPPIDILVEEMDNPEMKLFARQQARAHGIDVLMLSDFGHCVHLLWNPFRSDPGAKLGYAATDDELQKRVAAIRAGERRGMIGLIEGLCGPDFALDQLRDWIDGRGEHPTASVPQSGSTAMASGAIGGKELAMRVLGWPLPAGNRVIYNLLGRSATVG